MTGTSISLLSDEPEAAGQAGATPVLAAAWVRQPSPASVT